MHQRRIIALMLALFMLLAPLNDTVQTFAALAEATNGSLATSTPEVSAPTQTTQAPDTTDAPEAAGSPEVSAAPEDTDVPANTGSPDVTDAPANTGAPEVTDEPAATDAPDASDEPEATGTPGATSAPEGVESILTAVPRGFMFRAALSEDDSLKKTLGVTVEWVDDGVSHVNNLKLESVH